jgi:hypothetical protein
MSTKQSPVCQAGPKWLKEVATCYHTRIGLSEPRKDILAPLTGQDYQAYKTFLHALELYNYCDSDGEQHALLCMKHAVMAMQEKTRWIARATIPHLLDWETHKTLWPKILGAEAEVSDEQLWGEDRPASIEQHDVGGA